MLLNGAPVSEPDYSQLHATILYAQRGLKPPPDAYNIPGWDRTKVKMAFQTIINARNTQAAIGAISNGSEDRTHGCC